MGDSFSHPLKHGLAPFEESFFVVVQEWYAVDVDNVGCEAVVSRPCHKLEAETRPHSDFVVVGRAAVLAKLYRVVARPRFAVDLVVSVIVKRALDVTLQRLADAFGIGIPELLADKEDEAEREPESRPIARCPHCGKPVVVDLRGIYAEEGGEK